MAHEHEPLPPVRVPRKPQRQQERAAEYQRREKNYLRKQLNYLDPPRTRPHEPSPFVTLLVMIVAIVIIYLFATTMLTPSVHVFDAVPTMVVP